MAVANINLDLNDEERLVISSLLNQTFDELEEDFGHIFKLETFPGLTLNFNAFKESKRQPLAALGYRIETEEDSTIITSVIGDEVVLNIPAIDLYIEALNIKRLLDSMQYQVFFKELSRILMIYQLYKAYDIEHTNNRFAGKDLTDSYEEVFGPIIEHEMNLFYYQLLDKFYRENLPTNKISRSILNLVFNLIPETMKMGSVRLAAQQPRIVQQVWELVAQIRFEYPNE